MGIEISVREETIVNIERHREWNPIRPGNEMSFGMIGVVY